MMSLTRFHNFLLNLYGVIDDVTVWLKKFLDIIFLKSIVLKVPKILDPKHHNPIKFTK